MIWNTMIVSFTNIETFSWKSLAKCTKKGKNSMTSLLDRCLLRDLISIDWFRRSWWAPCMKLRSFSFTSSFRNPLFRAERRVWKLFSPDSWCLLKILLWTSIHDFSVKSLTSSIFWFHTHSFVLRTWVSQRLPPIPGDGGLILGPGFWNRSLQKWLVSNFCDLPTTRWWFQRWIQNLPPKHRKNWYTRACTYRIKQSPIVQDLQGRHCSHYHYSWRFLVCGWLTRNQKAGVTGLLLAKCFFSNMVKITIRKYSCCNFANFIPHIFLGKLKFWY